MTSIRNCFPTICQVISYM